MRSTILLLLIISLNSVVLQAQQSPIPQLQAALEECYELLPREKLYLHTDRSFYSPSETIWFKVYSTNAANTVTSEHSSVARIELLNPKGDIIAQETILLSSNQSNASFLLPKSSVGGIYKLRAYTSWIRNFGEEAFFEKEITVQRVNIPKILLELDIEKESYGAGDEVVADLKMRSIDGKVLGDYLFEYQVRLAGENVYKSVAFSDKEGKASIKYNLPNELTSADGLLNVMVGYGGNTESIARRIPILFDNIKLDFLPEGGDLVQQLPSKVAFKAVNEFGKPADVEGIIFNAQGEKVTTFSSFHDGMGAFEFRPQAEKYYAEITRPIGITKKYDLPQIYNEGVTGSLISQNDKEIVLDIRTSTARPLYAMLQMQERVLHTQTLEGNTLKIATDDFPMGIARLTIFDETGLPQWERLLFLNRHRQLNVNLETNKESYAPNSTVKLDLKVTDSAGKGVQGGFSLAVVDDKLHTYADDKQDDILSYFLMSSELKGKVHEPNFYFDPEEEKATEALEYVLLTHGWRSFNWKETLAADEVHWRAKIKYPKSMLSVKGRIYPAYKGVKAWVKETGEEIAIGKRGNFEIKHVDINQLPFTIMAKYKQSRKEIKVSSQQHLHIIDESLNGEKVTNRHGVQVGKDIYAKQQMAVKTEVLDETMPMAEGATASAQSSAKVRGQSTVMGSRTSDVGYYIDGVVVDGDVALDEVVVSAQSISTNEVALSVIALSSVAIKHTSWMEQDYDFQVGLAPKLMDLRLSVYTNHNNQARSGRRFYNARYHSPDKPAEPETIYWNPSIQTDKNGKASLSFNTSPEISTFRAIVEGIAESGIPARAETTFNTQTPFSIDTKIPVLLTQGDELELPISLKNGTNTSISGLLSYNLEDGFKLEKGHADMLDVAALEIVNLKPRLKVNAPPGEYDLVIHFKPAQGNTHEKVIKTKLKVVASTFPRAAYLSSRNLNTNYQFEIDNLVTGSVETEFRILPNGLDEITAGIEGILREPYGCFEQVSSSNYPNILALQLLQNREELDPEIKKKAEDYLSKGYKKLEGYEVEGGGFSLYGKAPASIGLTAFGLVQFHELQKALPIVNKRMIKRAIDWLLKKRDKNGLFGQGRAGAYQKYGKTSDAYVVYALSTMKVEDMEAALRHETELAEQDEDIYRLALLALANVNYGEKATADRLTGLLATKIRAQTLEDLKADATLMRSYGHSKQVEIAAWATLALCENQYADIELIHELVEYIQSKKRGAGYFGSTQATGLALQALSKYLIKFAEPTAPGDLELFINDELVASASYDENTELLAFNDLGQHFTEGANQVQVRFANTTQAVPYTLTTNWRAKLPAAQASSIKVTTTLPSEVPLGESVRLTARVHNNSDEAAPTPMAIIGIPSGLSIEARQVKELVEKGVFDYFEIQDNYLVAYYTELAPNATSVIELDLKTQFKGNFQAPPNSAFLYYQSEIKDWEAGKRITIN